MGKWGAYRHLLLPTEVLVTRRSDHVFASILHIGDLSSLRWLQGPLSEEKLSTKILYSSLGSRDLQFALGHTPIVCGSRLEQNVFGFDFSGIDLRTGKHIMGIVDKGAVSSHIEKSSQFCWEVPKTWSLRDAATVPIAYLTVYYAFFFKVDIRKGRSILIHAGSGGIGLAAIHVALAYGLEVFTTVSTAEKKALLLKTFPQLLGSHIGNSRNTFFESMIREQTDGGVDFVLNSLTEDKLLASIRCLGKLGKFLEIGNFDMNNDNKISLGHFLNEISFYAVLTDNLHDGDIELVENLKNLVGKDIARGIVKPLPSTVFMAHEIEQAFHYLSSGKHIGKVLIQTYEDPVSETTMPIAVIPRMYFSEDLVYIIQGGLTDFGLELIDWMVLRGARKILICSRRGITNGFQKFKINLWKSYGCQIVINSSVISTYEGCLKLIRGSAKLGSVGGIFHWVTFRTNTEELCRQSLGKKAWTTSYLDEISRRLCPLLQHFLVFSRTCCGRVNADQTNYSTEIFMMERIIENRIADRLPGKAIRCLVVEKGGVDAKMVENNINLESDYILQQGISSCIQELDNLIATPDGVFSSIVVAEREGDSKRF